MNQLMFSCQTVAPTTTMEHGLMQEGELTVPQWVASGAMDASSIFTNNALDFDGIKDFVWLPNAIELTAQPASTVEAWFRIDGDPADFQTIYSEENSAGATFYILRTVGNVVQYGVNDGSVWSFTTGSTQLEAGKWYHVAATYQDGVGTKAVFGWLFRG